mmetsp:Transcript_7081/g.6199  ORF Transcript_7081/g.6199 Transcript_7081/m.6199 type:complete len:129 (+) Transcript_7081:1757-2143(+)
MKNGSNLNKSILEKMMGSNEVEANQSDLKIRMFDNDISLTTSSKTSFSNSGYGKTSQLFKKQKGKFANQHMHIEDQKNKKTRILKKEASALSVKGPVEKNKFMSQANLFSSKNLEEMKSEPFKVYEET